MASAHLEAELVSALETLNTPGKWVHLATVSPDGGPHVTPVVLGYDNDALYLSVTGKQKNKNIGRDSRVCISISREGDLAHLTIWGDCELSIGPAAQEKWEWLIRSTLGEAAFIGMQRTLSIEGTQLGVVHPSRYRIYGLNS